MVLFGGERQRIALARGLYDNSRLVELEEPNANLDAASEEALVNAIKQLKVKGVTVIIIGQMCYNMSIRRRCCVVDRYRVM
jgi:ATP-binding cassette subfamily C protein